MAKEDSGRMRLGEVLVASGLLTPKQIEQGLARGRDRRKRLGETLVADGVLTQDQINWALGKHFDLAYVDIDGSTLDRDFIRTFRPGLLYQHACIPILRIRDSLTLAMADPTDSEAVLEVADATGCEVTCAIASANAILAALDSIFSADERRQALAGEPTANDFATMARHPVPRQRLGEILVDALLLSSEQLTAALARQKDAGKRLGELLIDDDILTEDQINWALARHLDVPYIDLTAEMVDPKLLESLPADFLVEHRVVPMMKVGTQVCVVMADPLDHEAIAEISKSTGCDVIASIAKRAAIDGILRRLERTQQPTAPATMSAPAIPVDLRVVDVEEQPRAAPDTVSLKALTTEGSHAFRQTLQQSALPHEEKIKVYEALHGVARARAQGGPKAELDARQKAFASLTPAALRLALQLGHQVGSREVPVLKDEEFKPKRGLVGSFFEADRRFIVDRRVYDRTVRQFTRKHSLTPVQIDNAVMAARAFVLTEGKKQILLITKGEKALAEALTKIIRVARTRESPPPKPAPYAGPERRKVSSATQDAIRKAIADSGLERPRRDKIVRALRLIHRTLGGHFDRPKLKALIREGLFVGFSKPEIALVERLLRILGYDLG